MTDYQVHIDELMEIVTVGDLRKASAYVRKLRATIGSTEALISEVLAPVQTEVGLRWETNEWNVAQEHLATGIVDATLADLSLQVDAPPVHDEVVVTCAESEWHVIPARMLSSILESHGWVVTFLGASTPADHLHSFLIDRPPAAVLVSASLSIHLTGARRTVNAAHDAGVPIMAGGHGLGPDDRRARAIGADAWADSAVGALSILDRWSAEAPQLARAEVAETTLPFAAQIPDIVARSFEALRERLPAFDQLSPAQLDRTKEDFGYILDYTRAAVDTQDGRIIDEFAPWLLRVLEARGLRPDVLAISIDILLEALPPGHDAVAEMLQRFVSAANLPDIATGATG